MAALLISENEGGNYVKLSKYIQATRDMGIHVKAPNINYSDRDFNVHNGEIVFGLQSIKGVGSKAVDTIFEERSKGLFTSLTDFYQRTKLDKTTNIALVKSGAFGDNKMELLEELMDNLFAPTPYKPVTSLPTMKKLVDLGLIKTKEEFKDKERCLALYNEYKRVKHEDEQRTKQEAKRNEFRKKYMQTPEMFEYQTLSIFLNGHPLDGYEDVFLDFAEADNGSKMMLGGVITDIRRKKSKKTNKPYCDIDLLTLYGMVECRVFDKNYAVYQDFLKKGFNVVLMAKKSGEQFIVDKIKLADMWKEEYERMQERKREAKRKQEEALALANSVNNFAC
ncbi:hypothetical protein QB910_000053 [Dabrowskivirus KKP3916]|uniref:DNA polymerase helix-hairpin-helix motif domain-containing protein n=1 Tax=Alicyclobacillus phage KKP_3916 TaxID=3040651 RepID=A0AAT9V8Q7_9CAUD|nr:hypothetical protein QB910_000053 [Alicyclobacillus phage KKP 3916]